MNISCEQQNLPSCYRTMLGRARGAVAMPCSAAEHGIATASRLSVRLSVTLRYRDHIGWNS